MGQLIGLVAVLGVAIGLWIQRGRAMARVVADAEGDSPVAACTVVGAGPVYDEVRWLRHALQAELEQQPADGATRVRVGITGGGVSLGVRHTSTSPSNAGASERRAHAANLRQGIAALAPGVRTVLGARGIEAQLVALPDRAERARGREAIVQMVSDLQHVEAGLTATP